MTFKNCLNYHFNEQTEQDGMLTNFFFFLRAYMNARLLSFFAVYDSLAEKGVQTNFRVRSVQRLSAIGLSF